LIRSLDVADIYFFMRATGWTLVLTAIAFAGAAIAGAIVAIVSLTGSRILRFVAWAYVLVFQGTPLLLQLFIVFFMPNLIGITMSPLGAATIALTLNGGAFLGEIWRGGLQAIHKGQWEAAGSIGLSKLQQIRWVIGPQAAKLTAPATVGFLVQLLKATSLTAIIGFTELTRAGQIVVNSTFEPFRVFGIIGIIYFFLCYPLSFLSRKLEARNNTPFGSIRATM